MVRNDIQHAHGTSRHPARAWYVTSSWTCVVTGSNGILAVVQCFNWHTLRHTVRAIAWYITSHHAVVMAWHHLASCDVHVCVHVADEVDDPSLSGKRAYAMCKYCNTIVMNRHDFRRHIRTHKDVDHNPWKCPLCDYRGELSLTPHTNTHTFANDL